MSSLSLKYNGTRMEQIVMAYNLTGIVFQTLPQPDLRRCTVAVTANNKQKNRYRTIFACKHLLW